MTLDWLGIANLSIGLLGLAGIAVLVYQWYVDHWSRWPFRVKAVKHRLARDREVWLYRYEVVNLASRSAVIDIFWVRPDGKEKSIADEAYENSREFDPSESAPYLTVGARDDLWGSTASSDRKEGTPTYVAIRVIDQRTQEARRYPFQIERPGRHDEDA